MLLALPQEFAESFGHTLIEFNPITTHRSFELRVKRESAELEPGIGIDQAESRCDAWLLVLLGLENQGLLLEIGLDLLLLDFLFSGPNKGLFLLGEPLLELLLGAFHQALPVRPFLQEIDGSVQGIAGLFARRTARVFLG